MMARARPAREVVVKRTREISTTDRIEQLRGGQCVQQRNQELVVGDVSLFGAQIEKGLKGRRGLTCRCMCLYRYYLYTLPHQVECERTVGRNENAGRCKEGGDRCLLCPTSPGGGVAQQTPGRTVHGGHRGQEDGERGRLAREELPRMQHGAQLAPSTRKKPRHRAPSHLGRPAQSKRLQGAANQDLLRAGTVRGVPALWVPVVE